MKYYHRVNYLRKIRGFYHDTSMIKVITGVRRCGKSYLMDPLFYNCLLADGVADYLI